jgi:type IV pilus assembly protein PilX
MHSLQSKMNRQRGAALVMGLLLLLVLTILAVSGMNSASVEFIMAGNDQYRQNSFHAAETGIERSLLVGIFNPANVQVVVNGAIPNTTDNFTANIDRQMNGQPLPAIWNYSAGSFSTFHFEVASTGTSARNSRSTNTQGVAVLAPYGGGTLNGPGGI